MLKILAPCAIFVPFAMMPATALAQAKLPSEADTTAVAQFMLPIALDGVISGCDGHLTADSYLMSNSENLRTEFSAAAEGSFENARGALFMLGGGSPMGPQSEDLELINEAMLREIVQQLVDAEVVGAMDAQACFIADRVMQDLAPLPAENLASLLGFLVREVGIQQRGGL